jgi:hypothetical protein
MSAQVTTTQTLPGFASTITFGKKQVRFLAIDHFNGGTYVLVVSASGTQSYIKINNRSLSWV